MAVWREGFYRCDKIVHTAHSVKEIRTVYSRRITLRHSFVIIIIIFNGEGLTVYIYGRTIGGTNAR